MQLVCQALCRTMYLIKSTLRDHYMIDIPILLKADEKSFRQLTTKPVEIDKFEVAKRTRKMASHTTSVKKLENLFDRDHSNG